MKTCITCKADKPIDDFHKNPCSLDGRQSNCKPCSNEYGRRYRESNVTKLREYNKERYKLVTQEDRRRAKYKARYGVSLDEYNKMLEAQGGVCAICSGEPTGKKQRLCVDHCHQTGKIRGLLCNECNVGIGRLKDSVELLVAAICYLEQWTPK